MNCDDFARLPYASQKAFVHGVGIFLALRWQNSSDLVLLYALPGYFFTELTFHTGTGMFGAIQAFEASQARPRLENYSLFVQLPDWMPAAE